MFDRDIILIGELHYTAIDPDDNSLCGGFAVIEQDADDNTYSWYSPSEESANDEPFTRLRECLAEYKRLVKTGRWKHIHFYWKESV